MPQATLLTQLRDALAAASSPEERCGLAETAAEALSAIASLSKQVAGGPGLEEFWGGVLAAGVGVLCAAPRELALRDRGIFFFHRMLGATAPAAFLPLIGPALGALVGQCGGEDLLQVQSLGTKWSGRRLPCVGVPLYPPINLRPPHTPSNSIFESALH